MKKCSNSNAGGLRQVAGMTPAPNSEQHNEGTQPGCINVMTFIYICQITDIYDKYQQKINVTMDIYKKYYLCKK